MVRHNRATVNIMSASATQCSHNNGKQYIKEQHLSCPPTLQDNAHNHTVTFNTQIAVDAWSLT